MKRNRYILGLILTVLLFISACGNKEQDQNKENNAETIENTESTSEFHTEDEVIAEENSESAEDTSETVSEESWVNHYYNRGIYFKDGYTYRQFADGLYRR